MCGRMKLSKNHEFLETFPPAKFPPRYNIAPTQQVPVLRIAKDGTRELAFLRWGLVPSWAENLAVGNRMINAKGETVSTKPAFRAAFKARRCLVLADGFYEWAKLPDGKKQPYLIELASGELFAFAGLWERWQSPEGQEVETCTILTTQANTAVAAIHDRMPVIILPTDYDSWFDSGDPSELLQPIAPELLSLQQVGTHVNNPRNDDERCVEAAG
jgi:putative SOS response-associated peptidase YedK